MTLIVQLELPASVAPQVLICVKSPLFGPVMVMPVMGMEAVLVLESVAVLVELFPILMVPKPSEAGASESADSPVPDKLTIWGVVAMTLSVTDTSAVRLPLHVGAKVTEMVQVRPIGTLEQVLVWL